MADRPFQHQCGKFLAALNKEHNWGLGVEDQQRYVDQVTTLVAQHNLDADVLPSMLKFYHQDHELVESLLDQRHPRHEEEVREWVKHAIRILRHNGLHWSNDEAIDEEDLVQIAATALIKALPTFHYRSRLSTWMHQVVTWSVQRQLRDSRAKKRAERPASLDQMTEAFVPIHESDHPERQVDAIVLHQLVEEVLRSHPDKRLAVIFKLKEDDQSVAEIGQHIQLSPQRVRALIKEIRDLLSANPSVRAWLVDLEAQPQEKERTG